MHDVEKLLQHLIAQGVITQEDFDRKVEERKRDLAEVPDSPHAQLNLLQMRTEGMQSIDDFTLQQIFSLLVRIEQLENRVAALEGGAS